MDLIHLNRTTQYSSEFNVELVPGKQLCDRTWVGCLDCSGWAAYRYNSKGNACKFWVKEIQDEADSMDLLWTLLAQDMVYRRIKEKVELISEGYYNLGWINSCIQFKARETKPRDVGGICMVYGVDLGTESRSYENFRTPFSKI